MDVSEFVDYLKEVFEQFGHIHARKMFGGYGIYHDGVMFGLVADDTLYLKADENTARYFESRDLGQFEYDKGGKIVKMSYYLAPEEILDNPEDAALWARRAYEVAFRAKSRTKRTSNK
jgi:DNA transformation protein